MQISNYFINLYNYIIKCIFNKNDIVYNLPFDSNLFINDDDFLNFKQDDNSVNKIIFALNNLPKEIHKFIFSNYNKVCDKYYYITINSINKNITHNLHELTNNIYELYDYIYIRIDVVQKNKINHINCIIIDKINLNIILFEPQVTFLYDSNKIIQLIKDHCTNLEKYNIIMPTDMGYTYFNKLQKYDAFCQTYALFAYLMVILNNKVSTDQYCNMFNSIINYKNMGFLLYWINIILKNNNFTIGEQQTHKLWSYPTKKLKNIVGLIRKKQTNFKPDYEQIDSVEEDGVIVI